MDVSIHQNPFIADDDPEVLNASADGAEGVTPPRDPSSVPIPDDFELTLPDGRARCLAATAAGAQCARLAVDGDVFCAHAAHNSPPPVGDPPIQEETMFPADRFARAGATPEELEQLQAEFDSLSEPAKASQVERFAAVAQSELTEVLEQWRETATAPEASEPEAVVEPVADPAPASPPPAATSSAASKAPMFSDPPADTK